MKLLIVGSKGFIGSHAEDHFKKKGHEIWGCDVIIDYTSEKYILIDATNADFCTLFQEHYFDVCINCSGAASVPDSLNYPLRDYYLNTVNVYKLLDSIRQYQPKCKFINLSSAAVYGNPSILPVIEKSDLHPLSPYGWHKLYAEQICSEFNRFYDIQVCSLRIFSAYGDGLKKQLFWDLYKKAQMETTFQLYGSGDESRDFIHVSDIVRAIDLIITNDEFNGNFINVANGVEIFIKDVVKIFYSLFDKKIPYSFSEQERKGDPNNWVADISQLRNMGYEPKIKLLDGLTKYYKWILKTENE